MSNRANETAELLRAAGRRLHQFGEHDLGDLLRDLSQGLNTYQFAGEQLTPMFESARAVAESVLAEPDQADAGDVCAQASAGDTNTACCGETTATPTAAECFRLAHEHMQAALKPTVAEHASLMHRAAADHYLGQACATLSAKAQGLL